MHIGKIVVVGINETFFLNSLIEYGYTILPVSKVSSILFIEEPYDLTLIDEDVFLEISDDSLERLYFINNNTPTAVLVKDNKNIPQKLLDRIKNNTIDVLYYFEILNKIIFHRIDRLIINARINKNLISSQNNYKTQEKMEKEIIFREQILNHEREVNANLIESITSGLFIFDNTGNIILTNEYAKQFYKSKEKDILGSPFSNVLNSEIAQIIEDLFTKKIYSFPIIKKCKINSSFFTLYCYQMINSQKQPNGIIVMINDITEQEEMSVLLFRSEKLATVGTMLSGIAHELRNPLSIISARINRLLEKQNIEKNNLIKNLNSINSQTLRCSSIINSILNFIRNTATSSGYHKINDILDETLTYVKYQDKFNEITISRCIKNDLLVYGDRSRYIQVFINVIGNAITAMNSSGTLKIITKYKRPSYTLIEINDTGQGIEEKYEKKIFDPFFTTKEPGEGTGLGLAIAYKIVQESNGKIWFKSKPGNTSFYIALPSEKVLTHES
ncbi:MAG: ATP-binding protein [Chitinispirillia bacterium]|jgi:signal transduction histidine kinase